MGGLGLNAEASSSRRTLDSISTRKSARSRALSNGTKVPTPPESVAHHNPAPQRKVRTVPPSAVLDPPTPPPLDSRPLFDTALNVQRPTPPRRRRRVKYISSDESSCESEDEDSDDEPPWWTFTARGMNKLRSMRGHEAGAVGGAESAGESGREGQGRPMRERRRKDNLRSSRSKDRRSPDRMDRAVSANSNSNNNTAAATPNMAGGGERRLSATTKLFQPRPFRLPTAASVLTRRSIDMSSGNGLGLSRPLDRSQSSSASGPGLTRSNSAPGRARSRDSVAAGLVLERTNTPEALADADDETPSNSKKPATVRRFLPTRHHRMSVDGMDNFTDSEATMVASPRSRAKQRMFGFGGGVPEETDAIDLTDPAPEDGTPLSPHSRMRRLNTNNLRIRLPEPISQHFANGWPHAGSWQDALRANDVFEERPKTEHRGSNHESRPESVHQPMSALNLPAAAMLNSAPPSTRTARREDSGSTDTDMANVARRPNRPPILQANRSSSETPVERPPARMKRKARKTKRYRQAQMPPTPGGPSYSPMVQRGTHTLGGQWNKPAGLGVGEINPFDNINPFDRIDEEYNLSPQNSMSEKDTKPSWAWFWGGRKPKHSALDHLSFHQRVRRMLFLDARVTIYIRLFNLAVVTTLLALSVTIRSNLDKLGYPGVVGPSTTLIISYASFTMVHVLTAIYREYFGRPIGLWGLRSKMLWVCLDLLFVALWSSAATLAINDYIDTPLDCTPLTPWWTPGYDYYGSDTTATVTATATDAMIRAGLYNVDTPVSDAVKASRQARDVCDRQIACIAIALLALLLYCGNMVLSLFRIFETVRRTAGSGSRSAAV